MPSDNEQVKFRLSDEEAAKVDEARGTTSRATYLKNLALGALEAPEEAPMREPALGPGPARGPISGRLMLWCEECGARNGDPSWRCPQHPRRTVVQKNRPYMGREVPTPKVEGLREVDAGAILSEMLRGKAKK